MQLWCVKRSKQAVPVAVHRGGQPGGQLQKRTTFMPPPTHSGANGSRTKPASSQMAHLMTEWFYLPVAAPRMADTAKGRKCIARRCSATRNVACVLSGAAT